MLLLDFFNGLKNKYGLSHNIVEKIIFLLIRNSPQEDITNIDIDNALFDKIALMKQHAVPEETIYIVIQNSLDWYNNLDVQKFWRELGVWRNKLGVSKEEIKQDIAKYKNDTRTKSKKIPLISAIRQLENMGLKRDFILDKLLNFMVDSETAENEVEDMYVDGGVLDTLFRMHNDGWSEEDMIRELEKQVDGKPGIDTRKFSRALPKDLIVNERKISAKDGSVKYTGRIEFLKYINPVLKFFTENADKIADLSKKYQHDNAEFARVFYNLYVNFRGWGDWGPELIIDLDKNPSMIGGFSPEGQIVLKKLSNQEMIINTIIHELMHFEQYLMLINTPDIGIMPYAKEHIMQAFLVLGHVYEQYDKEGRVSFEGDEFEKFDRPEMPLMIDLAKKRFEKDFYHNALKIPHEKITRESPKYAVVKKLANSLATVFNHNNRGNRRFLYPNLFSEQMAFAVGNAGAVMFRNIIMRERNKNLSESNEILDFATIKEY